MADSPEQNSDGVLKVTLESNGKALDTLLSVVVAIEVRQAFNRIPTARIELLDGDMAKQDFPLSNEDTLKPGSKIKISAGYGQQAQSIFEGLVLRHSVEIVGHEATRLIIECKDPSVAMTVARKNANYVDKKDSEIWSAIIGNYSDLTADVGTTQTKYSELVQFNCTDWDFIVNRAEVNGMLVNVENSKLTVKAPQVSSSPVLKTTYGIDLFEFRADLDATSQLSSVDSVSWDPGTQKIVKSTVKPQTLNDQGNLKSADLAKTLAVSDYRLQTPVPLKSSALKDWATGQQIKSGLSRLRGTLLFQGNSAAKVGSLIEVAGVGKRFNGKLFVCGVKHRLCEGQWTTEADFGMGPEWFSESRDVVGPSASGLTPGVEGLQIGVVKKLDEDPDKQNRIQVSIPVLEAQTEGVWARLANYYASNQFGAFFIPEIGDEVVLGYFNNDPSNPVILGSLYSSKLPPPYSLTAENNTKALVTRSKLKVELDEDKKVITIITPSENQIVMSDDGKSILVKDQNNNKIELNSSGITMDSPKDVTIKAGGSVSISATRNVDIKATSNVSVKGMNITAKADVGFTGKGSMAEVSASGITTIKGSLVMIN